LIKRELSILFSQLLSIYRGRGDEAEPLPVKSSPD